MSRLVNRHSVTNTTSLVYKNNETILKLCFDEGLKNCAVDEGEEIKEDDARCRRKKAETMTMVDPNPGSLNARGGIIWPFFQSRDEYMNR